VPHVADANIVQANTWMTEAVGGVRVLVPASQVEAARHAIAEFHAGAYQLEGEHATAVAYASQPLPLFSPDKAALLSFALTPAFGAAVQIANAASLGDSTRRIGQWVWLLILAAASVAGAVALHRISPGPLLIFRASLLLSFITVIWYFSTGMAQSRTLLGTYGPNYEKKSLAKPAFVVAVILLISGSVLSEFA